jgi:hypothetical protein
MGRTANEIYFEEAHSGPALGTRAGTRRQRADVTANLPGLDREGNKRRPVHVSRADPPSLDHLVGASEQRRRHRKAQRPSSRHIDDELERDRAHNWQIDEFSALENALSISAELLVDLGEADPVAHH